MFETSAHLAVKVDAVADALCALRPGETATYARLSKVAGERVAGSSYIVQRAIAKAEKLTGAIFDNVHGQGYQRLQTGDIPGVGKKANSRVRRIARKARKRFEGVRANDMTPKEVAAVAAYRSHFGMIEGVARESTVQALSSGIERSDPVPAAKIAERLSTLMRSK